MKPIVPSLANISGMLAAVVVAIASAGLSSTPSFASPKIALGTLTCKGRGNVSLILGSKQRLHCVFSSAIGGRHPYLATITKVGIDIGYTNASTFIWTVLGPTVEVPDNALVGTYGGLTAGASLWVGGNANALIGGSTSSIILQPVSLEGETGFNISAGVAGLTLEPG
jgi:hypothetical protein